MNIVAWLSTEVDPTTMANLCAGLTDKFYFTVFDEVIVIARRD